MDHKYQPLNGCLACNADVDSLIPLLDLGSQPLANDFHTLEDTLESYPLAVNRCVHCNHIQLSVAVDKKRMFDKYLYLSGTSATLRKYFEDFVADIDPTDGKPQDILEIACNDGSLLALLQARGHRVVGVDPADNIRPLSKAKGLNVHVDYWSGALAEHYKQAFDVIISQNVVAHVDDPKAFLTNVATALRSDGVAYVQTSQYFMLKNCEFDTIYHEHHSYFNLKSFALLAQRSGLYVFDAKLVPIHGTSVVWSLSHTKRVPSERYQKLLDAEDFVTDEYFNNFHNQAIIFKEKFLELLSSHRNKGYKIVGYGAAAKANTILNFNNMAVDYIIDDSPIKVGLYTPGLNIPIVAPSQLESETHPLFIIITAWNFAKEIKQRIKAIRNNPADICFIYFPTFQIV